MGPRQRNNFAAHYRIVYQNPPDCKHPGRGFVRNGRPARKGLTKLRSENIIG